MNYTVLSSLILLAPMIANAQTETLDYVGSLFTSVSVTGNNDGFANPIRNTGQLVLSSPLGDNLHNVAVIPLSFSLDSNSPFAPFLASNNPFSGPGDVASFRISTDANGMLTAWNIVVSSAILRGTNAESFAAVTINNKSGDSFSAGASNPSCGQPPGPPPGCFVLADSTGTPGVWRESPTMAPELDPASLASGLTLLFGGLAVLRGRR